MLLDGNIVHCPARQIKRASNNRVGHPFITGCIAYISDNAIYNYLV